MKKVKEIRTMINERINEEGVVLEELHIEEMEEVVAPGWALID